MKLTKYLEQVLHGLMLGDGHMYQANFTSNPRYTQTFGQHAELFANFIFKILREFCTDKGLYTYKVRSGKGSPLFQRWIVQTRTLAVFYDICGMYYAYNNLGKRIKILPLHIELILTPIVLAFLIMGDGNFHKQKGVIRIYTNNFTKEEVQLLSTAIYNKFGIESRLDRARKDQYILAFRKTQVPKLQALVKDHIIPSMMYRIGL
jgi:LAGLIDADG DNA endonuclease family